MIRHPVRPVRWILRNKARISRGLPVDFTPVSAVGGHRFSIGVVGTRGIPDITGRC